LARDGSIKIILASVKFLEEETEKNNYIVMKVW